MVGRTKPSGWRRVTLGLAAILGLAMAANGLAMLAEPVTWFLNVPGVGRTGPFNQHLVRDVGIVYLLVGVAFIGGVANPSMRLWSWGFASFFLAGHAAFHFWETLVGLCSTAIFLGDIPGVVLPAVMGIGLTLWAALRGGDHEAPADPYVIGR